MDCGKMYSSQVAVQLKCMEEGTKSKQEGGGGHSGQAHGHICPKCKLPQQGSSFAVDMHSFAGMVHNEDTTWNIDQIPSSLDVMSIFLHIILRDFLNYIIK